ncbi:MFS transporter [Polycladidibacter stylochi]|uniref:MFS transporter n=1 Tax=Polycladidibacter stylochi TaxID=1807766 RepID=UPI00082AB6D2|nr:MFS transporter [Pseudovibrio stylochi]
MFNALKDPHYGYRSPIMLLVLLSVAMQLSFGAWWNLMNNFAVHELGFGGPEIGLQQSVREIPGLLAASIVIFLLLFTEQTFAYISLVVLGIGVAVTGIFASKIGFLTTTFIMSIGFHYFETLRQSLSLQWLPKQTAAHNMGRILSISAFAQLCTYGLIYLSWQFLPVTYAQSFMTAGLVSTLLVIIAAFVFPHFKNGVRQNKKLVLRKRYWLFYALTFMGGARRQIFTVFAGFLMVEKFGYEVHQVASLFLINGLISVFLSAKLGAFIGKFGERTSLTLEYVGLILVFVSYAFVSNVYVAGALYVIDHAFFAMAIAIKTYFQKIADPADIAPTSGVSFTINHIAAVFIPVLFGMIWLYSPTLVFLLGAAMAFVSLVLARLVPHQPAVGNEFAFLEKQSSAITQAAE